MTDPILSDDIDATSDHANDDDSEMVDRVAEEFARRCRHGESPSIADYARRYPELAGRLRELLPSVAMMERLKGHAGSSSDPGPAEPTPASLGEYRIVRELGRGGMGIVYEAFQESLGRHVALKVIPRHGLLDARRRQRFQREATAVARLHHTNIVPIFAAGEHEGLPYYAMQYIRGSGLDRLIDGWRHGGLPRIDDHWRFAARVGMQAAEGLEYAHQQGILHRDVKPANLLVDEQGVTWITDFGLAKLAGSDDLTHSGDVVGTLRYLAPEALRGPADHRGDIYSLGLTLYELLTLRPPFGDRSPSELLRCVTDEQPIRPRKLDRSIPLDLETIVLKATAREPAHRYQTAQAMAEDLRAFLDDRPIRARRASPPERLARWCRRNRVLASVSAFAVASFLAALVFATVGYITTSRALSKSQADFQLSMNAIGRMFEALADPHDAGPFADDGSPDLRGRDPEPMPGGPMPPDGGGPPEKNLAIIEAVLDFYERFARENDTNETRPQFQEESALAYRKAAALYRMLGRDADADVARGRALERLESLAGRHPGVPEYRYELARTLAIDDFGFPAEGIDRPEADLRRAIGIVEPLFDQNPDRRRNMYAAALARWYNWLADDLDSRGRPDEAIAAFRAAIDRDEWLAGALDDDARVRGVLAGRRLAFAELLFRSGRGDEARTVVDRAEDDLAKAGGAARMLDHGPNGPIARRLASLNRFLRESGGEIQARRLDELTRRGRQWGPDGRSRGRGGGPPGKGQHGPGRGGPPGPPPDDGPPPP